MAKSMTKGKHFEHFVAFLEGLELPDGFTLEHGKRLKGADGVDEAEFDILISGRVGSADFMWLVECRDRPSSSSAPVSWVEQLVGRRDRFNLSKVTAVSTQPFSQPAVHLASQKGIDLRVVESVTPESFSTWLVMQHYLHTTNFSALEHVQIIVPDDLPDELDKAMSERFREFNVEEAILVANNNENCRPADVFREIASNQGLFDDLTPNGSKKRLRVIAEYPDPNDQYRISTDAGFVGVERIEFSGELFRVEEVVPLETASEYRKAESGAAITQTVTFGTVAINESNWAMRLVRDVESDVTKVMLVRTEPNS